MQEILRLFPEDIKRGIDLKLNNRWDRLQEIRLRLNQPIELIFDDGIEWIHVIKPSRKDGMYMVNQLSEFSLYRLEDELRKGYITIEGGHRVGLSGRVNTVGGAVKAIQYITFVNIRIAKEKIGVAKSIIPYMYDTTYLNTLFVGPPQTGKTTIIRDVTRIISTGWNQIQPKKVGVIDERSEIAASIKGIPQHNLGLRTDVMDACPKAEGMMMMIRSMSPEVLVVDEIGSDRDVEALLEAINAGVVVICTIHGQSLEELKKRPSIAPLLKQKVFKRIIVLKNSKKPGSIHQVFNEMDENIMKRTGVLTR